MLNAAGPKNRPGCRRNANSRPSRISWPSLGEGRSTYDLNFSAADLSDGKPPEANAARAQLVNRRMRTLFTKPSSINVANKFDPP